MAKIRLGMIGYGFRGSGLWAMCSQIDEFEPVAICDSNPKTQEAITKDFPGTTCFDDYITMLDSGGIDAVLIETPPTTHATCAIESLKRGIHLLSDVPAIHSLEEVNPLWQAKQASQAVYMFGATSNYWGFVKTCEELKDKGLLGKPFYLEAEYIHDLREFSKLTPWRMTYEPIRYCTHSLGPLLKWMGQELVEVSCFDTGGHIEPNSKGHDAMAALFRTGDNRVVKLLISFANSNAHGQHRFVCHGTKGYFECTWPLTGEDPTVGFSTREIYGLDRMIDLPVSASRPELPSLENVSGHGPIDYAMLVDFATAINGQPCEFDLRAGLAMTLPGLYALESAQQNGKTIPIKYPWD